MKNGVMLIAEEPETPDTCLKKAVNSEVFIRYKPSRIEQCKKSYYLNKSYKIGFWTNW